MINDKQPHQLWSAASHAVAPPALWKSTGGPQLLHDDRGSRWAIGDVHATVGLARRLAGKSGSGAAALFERLSSIDGRRGCQQRDGLAGEVLLPDAAALGTVMAIPDAGRVRDSISAYNDWIAGFVAGHPDHFVGVGQIPPTGLDDALAALRQCQARGLRAVSLAQPPGGAGTAPGGDAEAFWEAAGQTAICLAPTFGGPPIEEDVGPSIAAGRSPDRVAGFLSRFAFSGVPDRLRDVRLVVTDVEAGWLPYVLESADTNYMRASSTRVVSLPAEDALPSEYIRRFTWVTFHRDRFAVLRRAFFGEFHLMWSALLPSADGDWPNDEQQAAEICAGLPFEAVNRLVSENCRRLFGVGGAPIFTADEVDAFERPEFV